jgi:RNA polymerase sigma-70 factor (ECF subfamily)
MKDVRTDFIELYALAHPALRRFIFAHVPDYHEAEDALQSVSAVLWKKFDEYEKGTSFTSWAIQCARYEIYTVRRRHARSRVVLTPELSEKVAERLEPFDLASEDERQRALDHCLAQVAEEGRSLVVARYREGKRHAEIAKDTGKKESHVRTQLCRIRAALRKCIASQLGITDVLPTGAP